MKERERLNGRRGISPVISAVILSAIVLTIGGVLWAFSQSAMTISAEDYAHSVINMTDTISERFIIEHVAYIDSDSNLKVWIYNYGSVNIDVKIEVGGNGDYTLADDGTPAGSGAIPVVGGIGESTFTMGDGAPTAITVTAPDTTADFIAALYDAADTLLVGPTVSSGGVGVIDTVVLNYGYVVSTDYVVKITAATENYPDYWIDIMAGGFEDLPPLSYTATSGEELVIKAYTRRGNNAYYRYIVP